MDKETVINHLMDIPRVVFSGFTGWLIVGVLLVWGACCYVKSEIEQHEEHKRIERTLQYGELQR